MLKASDPVPPSDDRVGVGYKGHEPMLYEALRVIAGPFFKFTIVKMKRTQKTINN